SLSGRDRYGRGIPRRPRGRRPPRTESSAPRRPPRADGPPVFHLLARSAELATVAGRRAGSPLGAAAHALCRLVVRLSQATRPPPVDAARRRDQTCGAW